MCLRYLLLTQSRLPASGLGGPEPFLKAGSGAPLLGGARLRVQVSQVRNLQLVSSRWHGARLWRNAGEDNEGPDLRELTNSLQDTKKTVQGTAALDTWSMQQTLYLKTNI